MTKGVYLIVTGGGSEAISKILTAGGASSFFVGAELPYHNDMFIDIVGEVWDSKLVSERSAHQLAAAAFQKAQKCCGMPIGIGVSASLCRAENEREGRLNEAYIACVWYDGTGVVAATTKYVYGRKLRSFQEQHLALKIREAVHDCMDNEWQRWGNSYYKDLIAVPLSESVRVEYGALPMIPILSGSFNPVHQGHKEIWYKVQEACGGVGPIIEIPINHHNKASISPFEYRHRKQLIHQMIPHAHVVPSYHGMYVDKYRYYSNLFVNRNITFIMGADVYGKIAPEHKDLFKMLVVRRGEEQIVTHPNLVDHNIVIENQDSSTSIRSALRSL